MAIETDQEQLKNFSIVSVLKGSKCNDKIGKNFCWVDCEQDKVGYKDHCCRCVCRRGFALDSDGKSCIKVSWSKWGSWSKCIATEWGGLQVRERMCVSEKKKIAPGRCEGAGSESRSCSKITHSYLVRKNIRHLTNDELQDFVQAMTKFKQDRSLTGYDNIVGWHGWPFRCPWNKQYAGHKNGHCSFHTDVRFLSWHRLIVVQLERGLNKHLRNKTLGMPYWDWSDPEWKAVPELLTNETIYDRKTGTQTPNPFKTSLVRGHKPIFDGDDALYAQRLIKQELFRRPKSFLRGIARSITSDSYHFFDSNFEDNPHNAVHGCMCLKENATRCKYGMPTVNFAAWDPAFMLHHSQIDRMYVVFRKLREELKIQDWTKNRIFHSFRSTIMNHSSNASDLVKHSEEVLHGITMPLSPFCNASMNPEQLTLRRGVNHVLNNYYGKELFGYVYDSLDVGERDWRLLMVDMMKLRNRVNWDEPEARFVSALGRDLGVISKSTAKQGTTC